MRQCPLCSKQYEDDAAFCPLDGRVLLLPDPLLGRVVGGKYRIDAFLGGGAQSRVYRAMHMHLERPAAVKVIRGDFAAGDEGVERFRREALAIARLKHPNIVTVHDSGIDPDVGAYLVMEFLEGRSLRGEIVRHGRFSVEDALPFMRQLCEGVAAAHGAGVIHRDLKPDNVFLETRGDGVRSTKILDFGVAKLRRPPGEIFAEEDTDPYLSASLMAAGTPAYMSPEQCMQAPLDARSDIYSLGCVLFELLVGKPPFMADGGTTLFRKHVEEEPPVPSSLVPGLPPAADRVVLKALAKSPDDRYQTAGDFCAALEMLGTTYRQSGPLVWSGGGRPRRGSDRLSRNNLPQQVTAFIGRENEIAAVRGALATTRLVTITGPGGSGKTRLALQVAAGMLEEFPDGVWHAPLAALADPTLVPRAVASALGMQDANRSSVNVLLEFLQFKRLLLLLDNCEHLITACAGLADAILRACPLVRVVATSQEPLAILGEAAYALPPLSLPLTSQRLAPGDLNRYEAVRLFVDRARLVNPTFALSRENAYAIARVCQRLDGIPLAIELAAARSKVLSVEQINERLDDRFRLLSAGNRAAEPRQRTLEAAIDWSYDLLVGSARTVFDRLSVFAGGFDLDAAEAVCAGGDVRADEVLYVISNLVDKSLVVVDDDRGGLARYRLLQSIRQYGGERLFQSGEAPDARTRHRDYYLGFAERAERELRGPEQGVWFGRLELEHDNLRAALEWSKVDAATSDAYLRLAGALWEFWFVRGHEREGCAWLESALVASPSTSTEARAKALLGAGALARLCGDYTGAVDRLVESLAVARLLGDRSRIASALNHLGIVRHWQGQLDAASGLLAEALGVAREMGDRWETVPALKSLGIIAHMRGEHDRATALYEESLAISREIDAPWEIATTLNNLAVLLAGRGDHRRAAELFEEDLAIYRRLGDRRHVAIALNNLGELAQNQGDYERAGDLLSEGLLLNVEAGNRRAIAYGLECFASLLAARGVADKSLRLAAAADVLREQIGSPLTPAERGELERSIATARAALGAEAASNAWTSGRELSIEEAVSVALATTEGGYDSGALS